MKTKMELLCLMDEYLEVIATAYESGDFSELFPLLSEDCVFESQWGLTPNKGYDEVVSYLTGMGKTLKKTCDLPDCNFQELIENVNMVRNTEFVLNGEKKSGSFGLHYPPGEICLLIEQTIDNKSNSVILRIKLNDQNKISCIDLCMPELFRYRPYWRYLNLSLYKNDEELCEGQIFINEYYSNEFCLFLSMVGEEISGYDDLYIPIDKWIRFLECWKKFYSYETFDSAFEYFVGIDYDNFTSKNPIAKWYFCNSGNSIWDNRINSRNMLENLIEWTDKYKSLCDCIFCCF